MPQSPLTYRRPWRQTTDILSATIAEAVAATISQRVHREGMAEAAQQHSDITSEVLGDLIELLHTKGVLSQKDVSELISPDYSWRNPEPEQEELDDIAGD